MSLLGYSGPFIISGLPKIVRAILCCYIIPLVVFAKMFLVKDLEDFK